MDDSQKYSKDFHEFYVDMMEAKSPPHKKSLDPSGRLIRGREFDSTLQKCMLVALNEENHRLRETLALFIMVSLLLLTVLWIIIEMEYKTTMEVQENLIRKLMEINRLKGSQGFSFKEIRY